MPRSALNGQGDVKTYENSATAAMTRVSNQTNNLDPTSVNSRVFVGNLNTYAVAKEDVESVFARYGRVIGISMHKGYAFVQFTDCYDARNAVLGEDGRTIAGQILDVNMVTEPKPHQLTRKRRSSPRQPSDMLLEGGRLPRSGPHSSCSSVLSSPSSSCVLAMTPPNSKRIRTGPPPTPMETALFMHGVFNGAARGKGRPLKAQPTVVGPPFYCSEPDVLVCGICKQLFSCLQGLLDHKRRPCRLRFTCRCQDTGPAVNAPSTPQCAQCDAQCASWWDLVCHVEEAHGIAIYRHDEETEPTHRSVCDSPVPDVNEIRILPVHSSSTSATSNSNNNNNNSSTANTSPTISGTRINGVKVEDDNNNNNNNRIICNSEDSNSEEDQSENSKLLVEVSHDKCVDTTDLLIG